MFSIGTQKGKRESDSSDTSHDRSQYSPIVQHYDWDFDKTITQQSGEGFNFDDYTVQGALQFYNKWAHREDQMFEQLDRTIGTQHWSLPMTLHFGQYLLKNTKYRKQYQWFEDIQSRFYPIQKQFRSKMRKYKKELKEAAQEEKEEEKWSIQITKEATVIQKQSFWLLNKIRSLCSKIKTAFDSSPQSQSLQEKKTEK